MVSANDTLKLLAQNREPMEVDAICRALKVDSAVRSKGRRMVLYSLSVLIGRKLVKRIRTACAIGEHRVTYQALPAGRASVKRHEKIKPGPKGPHNGVRELEDSFRACLWRALRIEKKGSIPRLLELALDKDADEVSAASNARKYMKALIKAGVVVLMAQREKGEAQGSNGFNRYALVRDLGPAAPVPTKGGVFDPNSREMVSPPAAKTEAA
jgi:hypothetical protein